jgi:hypothetical protein
MDALAVLKNDFLVPKEDLEKIGDTTDTGKKILLPSS